MCIHTLQGTHTSIGTCYEGALARQLLVGGRQRHNSLKMGNTVSVSYVRTRGTGLARAGLSGVFSQSVTGACS